MPVYESEIVTREKLEELRKKMVCAVCGESLFIFWDMNKKLAFLACKDWLRTEHEGIGKLNQKEDNSYKGGVKQMVEVEKQHGLDKAKQFVKYQGVTSLTRPQAMEILETIWPDAPAADKVAAAILCSSYGLNPLANHVFLIPFKKGDKKVWARVWGIKAKRLLASRKGGYSYLDMTPRLMTEDEQKKVWGQVDTANLCYLTWLKDMKTGAEVYGYGKWPMNQEPYGTDKGNSKANMASIRSESQAIDRLRPAEMPSGWTATDEEYIEGESRIVDISTGEVTEEETEPEPTPDAPEPQTSPAKQETSVAAPKETRDIPLIVSTGWLKEKLDILQGKGLKGWTNPAVLSFMKMMYKVEGKDVFEVVAKLDKGQVANLKKKVEEALEMS